MVSVDDLDTNTKFAKEHEADFPILADPEKKVATAAKTGTTQTMRSRAHARFRLTAAAPKPVRISSHSSNEPS